MHLSISLATVALLALRHASAIKCRDHSPTADPLHPSADVITSIQQTLSLFPVAIDSKQYGLLDQVFTPTASVAFTPTEVPSGLSNIQAWLENVLKDLTSHHHLGGLQINQTNPCEATAINYLQGSFFGQGPAAGQIFFDFGYYEDQLVKDGGAGSNKWLVQSRVLHAVVSVNNHLPQAKR